MWVGGCSVEFAVDGELPVAEQTPVTGPAAHLRALSLQLLLFSCPFPSSSSSRVIFNTPMLCTLPVSGECSRPAWECCIGVKWKKSFGFWPEHRYRRAVSSVLWFCGSVYYLVIIEEQGSGWSVPLETWHLTGLQRASPSCHNRHFHAVVVLSFCQARIKILQLFGCLVTLASKGSSEMFVSREWTVLAPLAHNQRAKTMAKNSSALYLS